MFNRKSLFAAAALAVLSVAGVGSASAQAWDHRGDHQGRVEQRIDRHENRFDNRMDRREARFDHRMDGRRHYVDRARLNTVLWRNQYRVIGEPYFVHDRYVVRTHNRFGHIVLVQVDPWSGAFLGEVRL